MSEVKEMRKIVELLDKLAQVMVECGLNIHEVC